MDFAQYIPTIAVYALPVILAITLHEAAHAYAAKYFGDLTAYSQGRMSLNPVRHIDPVGTILVPLVLFLLTKGNFFFGWARPVPVNFAALRNPRKQMAWVSLAGPGANFVMAFGWMVLGILLVAVGVDEPFFRKVAQAGVLANVLFFVFNLVPIPPLDGGRILTSMLPPRYGYKFAQIEPYGFFIVVALVYLNILGVVMWPAMEATYSVLELLSSPFTIFL